MVTSWKGVIPQAVGQAEKAKEFSVLNCGNEQTDFSHTAWVLDPHSAHAGQSKLILQNGRTAPSSCSEHMKEAGRELRKGARKWL